MEVKIGIQSISRELIVETDATAEEVERTLAAALAGRSADGTGEAGGTGGAGGAGAPLFALATQKGGRILIPADKVAYVEFSTDQARRVGFGNIG